MSLLQQSTGVLDGPRCSVASGVTTHQSSLVIATFQTYPNIPINQTLAEPDKFSSCSSVDVLSKDVDNEMLVMSVVFRPTAPQHPHP